MGQKQQKLQDRILKISDDAVIESTGFANKGSELMISSILRTIIIEGDPKSDIKKRMTRAFATLAELKPRDGFEGLLIGQMITTFENAMACFSTALKNAKYPDYFFKFQNQGIGLMRLYSQQLETLDKHRNKGKQRMTIEHIHISNGGQAVIGDVTQGGGVANEK